ncbi:DNA-processing protein DprA [Phycicoccus ginsengisoli]
MTGRTTSGVGPPGVGPYGAGPSGVGPSGVRGAGEAASTPDVSATQVRRDLERVQRQVGDERLARIAWARLAEPEDPLVAQLVTACGALGALHGLEPGSELARRLHPRMADLDLSREPRILAALGARVLVPGDDEWPPGVEDLVPPLCLWVRGPADLAEVGERSVALVGARAATGYGLHVARELGAGLADRGFAVVSGAAYGIDAAAHEGALVAGGVTVAVLAGGIDRAYPVGHTGLLDRIAQDGAVVSEVPPGSAPTRWRFLSRNRLIATLSRGTVVVEAGLRSGSGNTARHAREARRVVGAVPGPVTSAASAGCHVLVREGAELVTDVAEVVELAGRIGELAPPKRAPVDAADLLDPVHRKALDALPHRGALGVEALAARAGLSTGQALAALGVLELEGLCTRRRGGWRKVSPPATAGAAERTTGDG